jgi:ketosteroid isomerase-like protein
MSRTLAISLLILFMQAPHGTAADKTGFRENAIHDLKAVEDEFAKVAADKDWVTAFGTYFDEDGLWFVPEPQRTKDSLGKLPPEAAKVKVDWYPTTTDASSSGTLGYNLGPYTWSNPDPAKPPRQGYFFTIWRRAAAGYRVAIDFGVNTGLPATEKRSDWKAVARREGKTEGEPLPALADLDNAKEYVWAKDAVMLRDGVAPRRGSAEIKKQLATEKDAVGFGFIDGRVEGDLGYTYGSLRKGKDTEPAGYYVHVWRLDPKHRWTLAVDVAKRIAPKAP